MTSRALSWQESKGAMTGGFVLRQTITKQAKAGVAGFIPYLTVTGEQQVVGSASLDSDGLRMLTSSRKVSTTKVW